MYHGLLNIFFNLCTNRRSILLYIHHDLIYCVIANDNVNSTISIHKVLHVYHKMKMIGTALDHMDFLLIYIVHILCPEHDNHAPPI